MADTPHGAPEPLLGLVVPSNTRSQYRPSPRYNGYGLPGEGLLPKQ